MGGRILDSHPTQRLIKGPPGFAAGKDKLILWFRRHSFDDLERRRSQRNAVLGTGFHAFGWHRPYRVVEIELLAPGAEDSSV